MNIFKGKGSKPRPCDKKKFNENYDRIFSKKQEDDLPRYVTSDPTYRARKALEDAIRGRDEK